jgi:glycosyltransferase involved in cell wall biosynthesis
VLEDYSVGPGKVRTIPNMVNTTEFTPSRRDALARRRYFLFTGRHSTVKGLEVLLSVGRLLKDAGAPFSILITGHGFGTPKLRRRIEKLRLDEYLLFTGFVERSRLIKLYQDSIGLILPSSYEGMSTSALEAMACGVPCIVANNRYNRQVVEDGSTGLLVDTSRPDLVVDVLTQLANQPEEALRIGNRARKVVEQKYSTVVVCSQIERTYEDVT